MNFITASLPTVRVSSLLAALAIIVNLSACMSNETASNQGSEMDAVAERYVKLVLRMGIHEPGYVDAYYGPEAWSAEVEADPGTLDDARSEAESLLTSLATLNPSTDDNLKVLRHTYLTRQIQSIITRIDMISGTRY